MKVLFVFATMVLANASLVIADTCANLSDVNSLYRLVVEKKAGDIQIKRLQQEVGVVADGKWGRLSEAAYSALLDRCGSYSYPGEVVQIDNAKVIDFFAEKTVFETIAVPECVNRRVPVYGEVQAPSDTGAVLGGAIAGGVIGKIVTDSDGGAAVGALIGVPSPTKANKITRLPKLLVTRIRWIAKIATLICLLKLKKVMRILRSSLKLMVSRIH